MTFRRAGQVHPTTIFFVIRPPVYSSMPRQLSNLSIPRATKRLTLITSLPSSMVEEGCSGIDGLYTRILGRISHDVHPDHERFYSRFRFVVGGNNTRVQSPSTDALSSLLGVSNIPTIICSFHSLLVNSGTDPVRVFYTSFPGRRKDKMSFVDPSVHHHEILLSCQSTCAGSGRSTLLGFPAVATMSSKYKR